MRTVRRARRSCRSSFCFDEVPDLVDHLLDGADTTQIVERHGDIEVILQLTHDLEHLQRVEPKVGEQLALQRRLDRTPADAFEDVDGVVLEPIGGLGDAGCVDQARKCSMNPRPVTTA